MTVTNSTDNTDGSLTFGLILDLSEHMLEQAREGNWHTVQAIEAKRRVLIQEYFSYPPVHSDAAMLSQQIRTVLELDDQVNALCRENRNDLAESLEEMSRGRQATQAYTRNS